MQILITIVAGFIWFKAAFTLWPWLIGLANDQDMGIIVTILILTWPFVIISFPSSLALIGAGDVFRKYTK